MQRSVSLDAVGEHLLERLGLGPRWRVEHHVGQGRLLLQQLPPAGDGQDDRIEAILERTMRTIEGSLPEGPDFHKELLDSAALSIEGIRKPLLSAQTVVALHDLRAFRHFVRHAYAVKLDPERLADLQRRTAALRGGLEEDLDALDGWLRELANAVE